MIRRTRMGEVVTTRHTHSTRPWFGLPAGTSLEHITVRTAPLISPGERQRLRMITPRPEADLSDMDRFHGAAASGGLAELFIRLAGFNVLPLKRREVK